MLFRSALIVFIETLDTVIVYLSNTLSFLRVSAFSLNHAALAIAIFTLSDMLGTFGTIVTLLLGNLFILVLEGGIVMIQVMRLEYYEGFSRYFSGDGHAFAPIHLARSPDEPRPEPDASATASRHPTTPVHRNRTIEV